MSRRWQPVGLAAFVLGFALAWLLFGWTGSDPGGAEPEFRPARGLSDDVFGADCRDVYGRFVGLDGERVAVFAGSPEGCRVLIGVQPLAAEDLRPFQRDDLRRGIVFHHDEELFQIIEGLAAP